MGWDGLAASSSCNAIMHASCELQAMHQDEKTVSGNYVIRGKETQMACVFPLNAF